ncbi:MAG: rhomboid family intramembrane serine protease [Pseudomonadota bacterium]
MFPLRDHNPSRRVPFVTWTLIALNVAIFAAYFWRPEQEVFQLVYADWALYPAAIVAGDDLYTLISAMFLHGGPMHIIGNMLFLYIFGDNLEDHFGHLGFLLFYLIAGFAASAAQIVADPGSTIPNIGASGAIAGVMGGYLLLFPKAKVDVLVVMGLITIIAMPAWTMLLLWFGIQVVSGLASIGATGGGVAYWAHAGGFAAGVVFVGLAWLMGQRPRRVDYHPDHPPTAASPFPAVRRDR